MCGLCVNALQVRGELHSHDQHDAAVTVHVHHTVLSGSAGAGFCAGRHGLQYGISRHAGQSTDDRRFRRCGASFPSGPQPRLDSILEFLTHCSCYIVLFFNHRQSYKKNSVVILRFSIWLMNWYPIWNTYLFTLTHLCSFCFNVLFSNECIHSFSFSKKYRPSFRLLTLLRFSYCTVSLFMAFDIFNSCGRLNIPSRLMVVIVGLYAVDSILAV